MDSLKLIPSIFFDIIARVVPGIFAIFSYVLIYHHNGTCYLDNQAIKALLTNSGAWILFTVLFFFAAYIIGQLISPFAKAIQRVGEMKVFKPTKKAPKRAYDRLRLNRKEAGSQCAKIRAEFTMHNGFAVVFILSSVMYHIVIDKWQGSIFFILFSLALVTAIRGRTTRDTFHETVRKFAKESGIKK